MNTKCLVFAQEDNDSNQGTSFGNHLGFTKYFTSFHFTCHDRVTIEICLILRIFFVTFSDFVSEIHFNGGEEEKKDFK